jgi:hypothetical protein
MISFTVAVHGPCRTRDGRVGRDIPAQDRTSIFAGVSRGTCKNCLSSSFLN